MKGYLIVVFTALFLVFAICGFASAADSSNSIIISGEVKNCLSDDPFPDVAITVTSNGSKIANTTTKSDGSYNLNFQSNYKVFEVTANKTGHTPSTKIVNILPNSNGELLGTANFKLGKNDVYVSNKGSDTNGDGTLLNPYATIPKAIEQLNNDGTIHLKAGKYFEWGLYIGKSMTILGDGQSTTIIDANGNGDSIFNVKSGVTLILKNLTLTNGYQYNLGKDGGAIYNFRGTLIAKNCTFSSNTGTRGGAIYNEGNAQITNCYFINNFAHQGGAIFNYMGGYLNVTSSTFVGNTVKRTFGDDIYNHWGCLGAAIFSTGYADAHFNRFIDGDDEIGCWIPGYVHAENNWFGSFDTPYSKVSWLVWAYPWLVIHVKADPSTVSFAENSVITADLNYNSNGEDVSKLGHVQDGTPISFIMMMNPSITAYSLNGEASVIYNANWNPFDPMQFAIPIVAAVDGIGMPTMVTIRSSLDSAGYPGQPDTTAPTVTASPEGSSYKKVTVILKAIDQHDVVILYTTDGSDPRTNGKIYVNPIIITNTTMLRYIAIDSYGNLSPEHKKNYIKNNESLNSNKDSNKGKSSPKVSASNIIEKVSMQDTGFPLTGLLLSLLLVAVGLISSKNRKQ